MYETKNDQLRDEDLVPHVGVPRFYWKPTSGRGPIRSSPAYQGLLAEATLLVLVCASAGTRHALSAANAPAVFEREKPRPPVQQCSRNSRNGDGFFRCSLAAMNKTTRKPSTPFTLTMKLKRQS